MAPISPKYRLSAAAESDVSIILRKSLKDFGNDAARRYIQLLFLAFQEIAKKTIPEGSREFESGIYLYHLRHSAKRAGINGITVRRPRHFVAFRDSSGTVEILRVLHDAMDIEIHLSDKAEPN